MKLGLQLGYWSAQPPENHAELVAAAERKMQGLTVDPAEMSAVLRHLFDQPGGDRLDTIVLGCTHFPLLGAELAAAAPHPVAWMDSGAAIARRVATMLGAIDPAWSGELPSNRAIFTAETALVAAMRPGLTGFGLDEINFIAI